jgi:hypothetical protein
MSTLGEELGLPPVPEYPREHQLEMGRKYNFIKPRIYWGTEFTRIPPKRQLNLFPSLEKLFMKELPTLLLRGKQQCTRIKYLVNKYNTTFKNAKKALIKAMIMKREELLYQEYCFYPEYFNWIHTPAYFEYCREFVKRIDQRNNDRNQNFEDTISRGDEHIISFNHHDPELFDQLDFKIWHQINCHGPMSGIIKHPGMTRKDFELLMSKGYLKLVKGNPDTLANHEFSEMVPNQDNQYFHPIPQPIEFDPDRYCSVCGEFLNRNTRGLNKKLGAHNPEDFKCFVCLDITEEKAMEMIEFYRSQGCTLFI